MPRLNSFIARQGRKFDVEAKATKLVSKIIPESLLAKKSLEQQVTMVHKAIGIMSGLPRSSVEKATSKVRSDLLKGLPGDIKEMHKEGKTDDEIKQYYWGCEPFRDLWVNTLKMEEATLNVLVEDTLTGE